MGVKGVNKSGNGFYLFKMFNDEGSDHGAAGIPGTTGRVIFVMDAG